MPNWLFVTMKTTGRRHSAARLSVSPNVPWFEAPSPNTHSVDLLRAAVVGGQRHARGEREVAADDPVAAHEAVLEVEHVHRAAAAVRHAGLAAEQLGHDPVGLGAARQRVAVRAVGRDQVILVAHGADGADDRRLLADGEVEEATDLRLRVHLARALLEAADEHHRLEPLARGFALRQLALRGPLPLLLGDVGHGPRTLARDSRRLGLGAPHPPRGTPTPRAGRHSAMRSFSATPPLPPRPPGGCWPARTSGRCGRRTSAGVGPRRS